MTDIQSVKEDLFFKLWRNKVIRNEIIYRCRQFNSFINKEIILEIDNIESYKQKDYLNKLKIICNNNKKLSKRESDNIINIIKSNLFEMSLNLNEIEIEYNQEFKIQENSIPDTVTTLIFKGTKSKRYTFQKFTKSILPNSITRLEFIHCSFNQSLQGNWLPDGGLKILKLSSTSFLDHTIKKDQLPNTLTQLSLSVYYKGIIEYGAIPESCKSSLHYNHNTRKNNRITSNSLCKFYTSLEFDEYFNQIINENDIPHNVHTIKFSDSFNSEIKPNSLPLLLTSIDMGGYNLELIPNLFPQSIKHIKLLHYNQPIPTNYFTNLVNLETLELPSK